MFCHFKEYLLLGIEMSLTAAIKRTKIMTSKVASSLKSYKMWWFHMTAVTVFRIKFCLVWDTVGIIEGIMCAMVPEGIVLTISGLCGDPYKLLVYLKETHKGKSFESKYNSIQGAPILKISVCLTTFSTEVWKGVFGQISLQFVIGNKFATEYSVLSIASLRQF